LHLNENLLSNSFDIWSTLTIIAGYINLKVLEPTPEKKTRLFALILTQHRLWGTILLPYIIVSDIHRKYFKLTEQLFPFPDSETMSTLSQEERDTVKVLNDYSDRNLFRLFSKNPNVKEFLEKTTKEHIEKFIRPYIETRIFNCLTIARDEAIPVYLQKGKIGTLHPEDQLILCGDPGRPVFRFERNEEQSTYSLSLETGDRIINLKSNNIDILTLSPCLIRENNNVLFVSDIDGLKLRPFLTKENILIPKNAEAKYFAGFVLNAINNFRVEGKGFRIVEAEPVRTPCLNVEAGLRGSPVMILTFDYSGIGIFADDPSSTFTVFENNDNLFTYTKYRRDYTWEQECIKVLGELGFFADDNIHFSPVNSGGEKSAELYSMIEAVNRGWNDLISYGFIIVGKKLDHEYNLKPVTVEISRRLEDDWFDLKAIVRVGEWQIPFIRFRKNILNGIREFSLPDGSIMILPETWFAKYKSIFEFGTSSDDSLRIHKQHFSLLSDTFDDKDCDGCGDLDKLLSPEQVKPLQPPAGLNCEMRQYQVEGLSWLHWLQSAKLGGCLADDMGLGKTIQTLALLIYNIENLPSTFKSNSETGQALFEMPQQKFTSLIVVPASLIYNWENEIKRFAPQLNFFTNKENHKKNTTSYFQSFDIILSSYHTIRQDIDIIDSFRFHYVVLDESQVIKNPASMIFRTVIRLKADYRLVLTGTPVENSLTDLWTQLNFVNPGLLGNLSFFRREFAKPIEKKKDDDRELRLRKIIKPFILRRTKEMVAKDLPAVIEQTVFCDMTEEQAKLYEEEKSAVRNSILRNIDAAGLEKSAIVVLQGLMKLRQLSNHPVMAYEDYKSGSGKFETVLQNMESVISEGHKILVFSSFVRHLDLYADVFRKNRTSFSLLTGSSTNREKIVNGFQNDPSNKIFLISLKAGGVGLNLTAADYVFILDPWWNPAAEVQALSRAHRIGQDKSVFVYRYISSNSIEEKIIRLQEKKSRLADTFIHSNNPLKDIDLNSILDIIG
jgi:superfamily II DNA or RNA helicase